VPVGLLGVMGLGRLRLCGHGSKPNPVARRGAVPCSAGCNRELVIRTGSCSGAGSRRGRGATSLSGGP
jgi:hypothetical protein